jgi:hypothetical protein
MEGDTKMTEYEITIHREPAELHFSIQTAARMARVTEAFIYQCGDEELVTISHTASGEIGLCSSDVRRLKLVRHLYEDLGFKLENIEFVLRLRQHLYQLSDREKRMTAEFRRRERELLSEIADLRRKMGGDV